MFWSSEVGLLVGDEFMRVESLRMGLGRFHHVRTREKTVSKKQELGQCGSGHRAAKLSFSDPRDSLSPIPEG